MKLLKNKDALGRTVILCEDINENLCWAVISKKTEAHKDMDFLFAEIIKEESVSEDFGMKLHLFGFIKIKLAMKNTGETK